jgi:hypothetical protein
VVAPRLRRRRERTRARVPQQTDAGSSREATRRAPRSAVAAPRLRGDRRASDMRDSMSVEFGTRARVRSRRLPTVNGDPQPVRNHRSGSLVRSPSCTIPDSKSAQLRTTTIGLERTTRDGSRCAFGGAGSHRAFGGAGNARVPACRNGPTRSLRAKRTAERHEARRRRIVRAANVRRPTCATRRRSSAARGLACGPGAGRRSTEIRSRFGVIAAAPGSARRRAGFRLQRVRSCARRRSSWNGRRATGRAAPSAATGRTAPSAAPGANASPRAATDRRGIATRSETKSDTKRGDVSSPTRRRSGVRHARLDVGRVRHAGSRAFPAPPDGQRRSAAGSESSQRFLGPLAVVHDSGFKECAVAHNDDRLGTDDARRVALRLRRRRVAPRLRRRRERTRPRVPQRTDAGLPREAKRRATRSAATSHRPRGEGPASDMRDSTSVEFGTRARVRSRRLPTVNGDAELISRSIAAAPWSARRRTRFRLQRVRNCAQRRPAWNGRHVTGRAAPSAARERTRARVPQQTDAGFSREANRRAPRSAAAAHRRRNGGSSPTRRKSGVRHARLDVGRVRHAGSRAVPAPASGRGEPAPT